jgi:cytochrome P450
MTFIYVVYDLIDHPEYIQLLREEIDSVWKEGDELTKAVLYMLKLMDSFMKESQRLSPVTLGGLKISFFPENQNFITSKGVLLLINTPFQ